MKGPRNGLCRATAETSGNDGIRTRRLRCDSLRKTDRTLPCLILLHSGSGIRPPQAVPASIAINDECLHALSQPDRNQLLRRFPELPVDEIGCQAAHQRELFGLTRADLQCSRLERRKRLLHQFVRSH